MKARSLNPFKKLTQDFQGLVRLWPFLKSNRGILFTACFLIPLISLLQMTVPILLRWTVDQGIVAKDQSVLMYGALAYFCVVIVEYGARACQTILTSKAVFRMIRAMRMALVQHILSLSPRYHDKHMSGALVTRATSDFDNLSEALNQGVLNSLVDFAVLIGAVLGLFLLNWKLAIIALVILPLVVLIIVMFSRALKRSMLLARVKIAALNAFTQECLYGQSTVKLLNAQRDSQKRFDKLSIEYRDAQMKSVVVDAILFALLDGVSVITIGLVLWYAVTGEHSSDALSAGVMIAFVQYIQNLFDPLKQLGNKIAMLQGAFTALDRIFAIFDTKDFVEGELGTPLLQGSVRFEDVSFSYQRDGKNPILHHLSFAIEPGRSMAVVGATGSGKSTVVKLLSKMYDGFQGEIKLDGHSIRTMAGRDLRRKIAIVPQDIVIFQESIAFNIGLGDPDIDMRRIEEAARFVGANRFIERLPDGYQTILREGGDDLSQGQRQLLAFARAVARNPSIIILDEATSSVDPVAEGAIQQAIEKLFAGRTLIVIAHRLSTIRKCNSILVLDRGRMVEIGSHSNLMQKRGAYFALHEKLSEDQAEEAAAPSSGS